MHNTTYCVPPYRVEEVCLVLCIAAHPKRTRVAFLASVVAFPTVFLVRRHWIHNMTIAAYLCLLAFHPALPAMKSVRFQIHAFLAATL